MMFSSSCREPLTIDVAATSVVAKPASVSTPEASVAQVVGPPPEAARAKADGESDGRVSADAAPLVVDFDPPSSGGGDEVMVVAFKTAPRPGVGVGNDAFPIPSSSVAETAKDKAIAVATASPPGPGHSTLVCTPPYSGSVPARPDASGQFPLAALVEQRAKEQLADVTLLRSSVEYALSHAAKEVTMVKRELEAAKGLVLLPSHAFLLRCLVSFLCGLV